MAGEQVWPAGGSGQRVSKSGKFRQPSRTVKLVLPVVDTARTGKGCGPAAAEGVNSPAVVPACHGARPRPFARNVRNAQAVSLHRWFARSETVRSWHRAVAVANCKAVDSCPKRQRQNSAVLLNSVSVVEMGTGVLTPCGADPPVAEGKRREKC